MSVNKSKKELLSADRSSASGVLNKDLIADNSNEPVAIHPPASRSLSSTLFDPDILAHGSQVSDSWLESLSQSETSNLLVEKIQKKFGKKNKDPKNSDLQSASTTESESEELLQKKRADLRSKMKKTSRSDNSNAFTKALETTTDSNNSAHVNSRIFAKPGPRFTKTGTNDPNNFQRTLQSEGAPARVETGIIRKPGPKFTKNAKAGVNNFDNTLVSNSAADKVRTSHRPPKRSSDEDEGIATPEKQQRLIRTIAEIMAHGSTSTDVNIINTSRAGSTVGDTRNRSNVTLPTNSTPPSASTGTSKSNNKRRSEEQSQDASSSRPRKKRLGDYCVSIREKKISRSQKAAASTPEGKEQSKTHDDSEDSSLSKNRKRTRSRSLLDGERSAESVLDGDALEAMSSEKASQSATSQTRNSNAQKSTRSIYRIADSSSSDEEIFVPRHSRKKPQLAERKKPAKRGEKARRQLQSYDSSDVDSHQLSQFFKSATEDESSRAEGTPRVQSPDAERASTHPSKAKRSKHNNSDKTEPAKVQLPIVESSDEEIFTPIADRKQAKPSEETGKSSDKAASASSGKTGTGSVAISPILSKHRRRAQLFPRKSNNPSDPSASSAAKDRSKDKEQPVANKSQKNQSTSASKDKSTSRESSRANDDNDEDSSVSTTERLRQLRAQREKSKDGNDDNDGAAEAEVGSGNKAASSHKSQRSKSTKEHNSVTRDAPPRKSFRLAGPNAAGAQRVRENRERSSRKLAANTVPSGGERIVHSRASEEASDRRSVETSTDGTPAVPPRASSTPVPPPGSSAAKQTSASSAKSTHQSPHPPAPVQSPRVPQRKPVNRVLHFSSDSSDDEEQVPTAAVAEASRAGLSAPREDDEGWDESKLAPHLRRFLNLSPKTASQQVQSSNKGGSSIDWEKAKQHTDAVKARAEAQLRLAEEARRQQELEQQRIDEGFRRLQARKEYRRKLRKRKPVHEAYLVGGKPYRPPRLPRPKTWATDKLYEHLWKCMTPKFGIGTRVKSEKFVVKLAEFVEMVAKRKKFEKYAAELEEFMVLMARLGIVETRYDFYRFCSDFMPYSFREKVVPMRLPGVNKRNIPFDPQLLSKPLLDETIAQQEQEEEEEEEEANENEENEENEDNEDSDEL